MHCLNVVPILEGMDWVSPKTEKPSFLETGHTEYQVLKKPKFYAYVKNVILLE
jgi:hypothetical protein